MNYKIERGREEINSTGGIAPGGQLFRKANIFSRVNGLIMSGVKGGRISHGGILKSMVGLFCEGRSDYADIGSHRGDSVFQESLELEKIPSEETLRQRMNHAAETITDVVRIDCENREMKAATQPKIQSKRESGNSFTDSGE